jgi:hypothetical protein
MCSSLASLSSLQIKAATTLESREFLVIDPRTTAGAATLRHLGFPRISIATDQVVLNSTRMGKMKPLLTKALAPLVRPLVEVIIFPDSTHSQSNMVMALNDVHDAFPPLCIDWSARKQVIA